MRATATLTSSSVIFAFSRAASIICAAISGPIVLTKSASTSAAGAHSPLTLTISFMALPLTFISVGGYETDRSPSEYWPPRADARRGQEPTTKVRRGIFPCCSAPGAAGVASMAPRPVMKARRFILVPPAGRMVGGTRDVSKGRPRRDSLEVKKAGT